MLTVICFMYMIGAMVTKKYEVDEKYWIIDRNNKFSVEKRPKRIKDLDLKGSELELHAFLFVAIGFTTGIVATGLLIKRRVFI